MNLNQVTMPVINMREAVSFYLTLGFELVVDTEHYARFACLQGNATFSLALAQEGGAGTVVYFEEENLDAWVEKLLGKGILFESLPEDKPYLWREAVLQDPSGNKLKLYWAGENRLNPPWKVSAD